MPQASNNHMNLHVYNNWCWNVGWILQYFTLSSFHKLKIIACGGTSCKIIKMPGFGLCHWSPFRWPVEPCCDVLVTWKLCTATYCQSVQLVDTMDVNVHRIHSLYQLIWEYQKSQCKKKSVAEKIGQNGRLGGSQDFQCGNVTLLCFFVLPGRVCKRRCQFLQIPFFCNGT